ncbi:hypothetical protein [Candidatus Protochlamydia phocaeensis]|uniref:hypothetical protein n=1 Tax=Candidatus Protochlamydia phocaeensis TaxID=1414722 RepID=UPI0008399D22|nr:hypothetical protein [Candidatus Protochlamydia phocaeensis]
MDAHKIPDSYLKKKRLYRHKKPFIAERFANKGKPFGFFLSTNLHNQMPSRMQLKAKSLPAIFKLMLLKIPEKVFFRFMPYLKI